MKKIIIFMVIFVLLFSGLSIAMDNDNIKIQKAEKYFSQAEKRTIIHRVNVEK
jgi:Skp family chaperone for outer membrane proteins